MHARGFFTITGITLICISAAFTICSAQTFPNKPITIIVPFSAGGAADVGTRLIAEQAKKEFKVPIVVENIGEAAGIKGLVHVYKASPDGYTLLNLLVPRHVLTEMVLNPPVKVLNYTPILAFHEQSMFVIVRKESKYNTFEELRKASLKSSLSCGISGMGSHAHLNAMVLKKEVGVNLDVVPFKGSAPAITALMGGHVEFGVENDMSFAAQREGIRCLAAFSTERRKAFPDVPTLQELGYRSKGDIGADYQGIVAPPNLSQGLRQVLEEGFAKAAKSSQVIEQLEKLGSTPHYLTGKEFHEAARIYRDKLIEYKNLF